MDDHSWRLIDDEQRPVFEDDIERHLLRGDVPVRLDPALNEHPLTPEHPVPCAHQPAIHLNGAGLYPPLKPRPRILWQGLRERLVEAQPRKVPGQVQRMATEL